MFFNPSNYEDQADVLYSEKPSDLLTLRWTDGATRLRESARLGTITSAVIATAAVMFNFNSCIPATITIISGMTWLSSRYLSNTIEPQAEMMINSLQKKTSEIQKELNAEKQMKLQLIRDIDKMVRADQHARTLWFNAKKEEYSFAKELEKEFIDLDHRHTDKLKEIIATHGWPGCSLVGKRAAHDFWLLIQHTHDVEFKSKCLEHMRKAVERNDASREDLAYLIDRVNMNLNKPQVYGSQLDYPIEDEANVDKRRAEMGMSPLADYLEFCKKQWN